MGFASTSGRGSSTESVLHPLAPPITTSGWRLLGSISRFPLSLKNDGTPTALTAEPRSPKVRVPEAGAQIWAKQIWIVPREVPNQAEKIFSRDSTEIGSMIGPILGGVVIDRGVMTTTVLAEVEVAVGEAISTQETEMASASGAEAVGTDSITTVLMNPAAILEERV